MPEDEIVKQLVEEHKDDFEPTIPSIDDQGGDSGGDNGEDTSSDAPVGDDDSDKDIELQPESDEAGEDAKKSEEGSDEPDGDDGGEDAGTESVGEKKDANSRIRQLNEEKKRLAEEKEALAEEKRLIEEKLAEKERREREVAEEAEDPVYTVDDFIGTLDENGDMLSDGEAKARFKAWEADYKLRQYEKREVMKQEAETLLKMQAETKDAFDRFPEFNAKSDKYDKDLADIANEAFRAGLIYKAGHEGDDNYIIGSKVNPGELLEKLHNKFAKKEPVVTKVNNLGDDDGPVISSQQVNKKVNQYAPGFRGEVDKEVDKILKGVK